MTNETLKNGTCYEWDGCCGPKETAMYSTLLLVVVAAGCGIFGPVTWLAARNTKRDNDARAAFSLYCCLGMGPLLDAQLPVVAYYLARCTQTNATQLPDFAFAALVLGLVLVGLCGCLGGTSRFNRRRRPVVVAAGLGLFWIAWTLAVVVFACAVSFIAPPEAGAEWGHAYIRRAKGTRRASDATSIECKDTEANYFGTWTLFYGGYLLWSTRLLLSREISRRDLAFHLLTSGGSVIVAAAQWHLCLHRRDGRAAGRFTGGLFLVSFPVLFWAAWATVNRWRNRRKLRKLIESAADTGRILERDEKWGLYRQHCIDPMTDLVHGETLGCGGRTYADSGLALAVGAALALHLVVLGELRKAL